MSSLNQGGTILSGNRLPAPIADALDRLVRRRRTILLVRGALAVAAVAIVALLIAMAIDAAVTLVSPWARWALSGAIAAAGVAAVGLFIVRPLLRRADHTHVARVIETHHPEIEERISSAVELLTSTTDRHAESSGALLEQLTREAVEHIRHVEPAREFNFRAARAWLLAAACAAVVFAGVWIGYPGAAPRLVLRAVAPFANVGSVAASEMKLVPGGDSVVMSGDNLRVEAVFNGDVARDVVVLRENSDGGETVVAMTQAVDADPLTTRFAAVLPVGAESFRYRVSADRRLVSRYFSVVSTPRPVVDSLSATLRYPAYVGRSDTAIEQVGPQLRAPHGTRIELSATFNKPLATATLAGERSAVAAASANLAATPPSATWSLVAGAPHAGQFRIETADSHSFTGEARRFELLAESDAPPRVRWIAPTRSQISVSPADAIALAYEVDEDHGIASATLLVQPEGKAAGRFEVFKPARVAVNAARWTARDRIELSKLELSGVPRLHIRIEIADTRPSDLGGAQVALSDPIVVTLDHAAASHVAQELRARGNAVADQLRAAMGELHQAREQMRAGVIPQVSAEGVQLSAHVTQAIAAVRQRVVKAEQTLAEALSPTGDLERLYPNVAGDVEQALASHVRPARVAVDSIAIGDTKDEQKADAQTAHDHIEAARAALERALVTLAGDIERVAQQHALADRSRALADGQQRLRKIAERTIDESEREGIRKQIVDRILDDQREVAAKAEQLATGLSTSGWSGGGEHQAAAAAARAAAGQVQSGDLPAASASARQAAGQMGALGQKLGDSPPAKPAADPLGWSEQASNLARRQENIADQIDAVGKGDLDAAIKSMQKDVAEQASALASAAAAQAQAQAQAQSTPAGQAPQDGPMPDPNNPSGPQAASQLPTDAQVAADELQHAADLANQAAVELGKPDPRGRYLPPKLAQGEQAPSDNPGASPEGGRGTKGGGSNTGAGSSNKPSPPNANQNNTQGGGPNPPRPPGKQNFANNVSRSQSQGSPFASQNASANAMKNAADSLEGNRPPNLSAPKGAGSTPGQQLGPDTGQPQPGMAGQGKDGQGQKPGTPGTPGKPGGDTSKGGGAKLGVGGDDIESGENPFGIPAADWLKLPADLRTQMMTAGDDRAPIEYREIVRRYFRDLARLGSDDGTGG